MDNRLSLLLVVAQTGSESDSWERVAALRLEAEDCARAGNDLGAAMNDRQATLMVERIKGSRSIG